MKKILNFLKNIYLLPLRIVLVLFMIIVFIIVIIIFTISMLYKSPLLLISEEYRNKSKKSLKKLRKFFKTKK